MSCTKRYRLDFSSVSWPNKLYDRNMAASPHAPEGSVYLDDNTSFICNTKEIYKHDLQECLLHDGKRIKWLESFELLKKFISYDLGPHGKWLSPGGSCKMFESSNTDLVCTWYS